MSCARHPTLAVVSTVSIQDPHRLGDGSSLGRVLAFEVPSASDPGGTRLRVLVVLKAANRLSRYFVVTALALSRAALLYCLEFL